MFSCLEGQFLKPIQDNRIYESSRSTLIILILFYCVIPNGQGSGGIFPGRNLVVVAVVRVCFPAWPWVMMRTPFICEGEEPCHDLYRRFPYPFALFPCYQP